MLQEKLSRDDFLKEDIVGRPMTHFSPTPQGWSASHLCKAAAEEVVAVYVYRVHGVLMETQQCLLEDFI